ncbi:MAG TPA: CHAD domain-containing protein [Puia sp.]|nr:CHAD domain-containing protein [Puia sp.]
MLSRKRQRRYITEKGRQWLEELAAFDESRDEEALHRLRLGIKKIRALVRLSEGVRGKRLAGDFRRLKKMFRQAGVIRDTNNQLHLLEERQLLSPEYKEQQVRQIGAAADKFARKIKSYQKTGKKAERQLLADVHSIRGRRIRRWFADEIIGTGILLTSAGDELHLARKKIKTLLYVLKLLPHGLAAQLNLDKEYLDRLQSAIGKWHDTLVAASDWPDKGTAGEQQLMRECRDKEQAIRVLADDFYRKAHR